MPIQSDVWPLIENVLLATTDLNMQDRPEILVLGIKHFFGDQTF